MPWRYAFDELQRSMSARTRAGGEYERRAPDVAQVGSTWVPYFAERQALLAPPASGGATRRWYGPVARRS
jgi:hypothetical protein